MTISPDRGVPAPKSSAESSAANGTTRRQFVGYVLAGSTLAVAAQVGFDTLLPGTARAEASPVPSNPQQFDFYDLSDLLRDQCRPTNRLVTIEIARNGTAVFDMPRAECGQGITTSIAMVIADALDMPVKNVKIKMADARPELIYGQLTGGSSTLYSLFEPLQAAAQVARQRLSSAAAARWGVPVSALTLRDGAVFGPDGRLATYGDLTEEAASATTQAEYIDAVPAVAGKVIGRNMRRVDALAAVTGRKKFAMDLKVSGALPTMVCRPPTFNGTVQSVENLDAVKKMPGVTNVATIVLGQNPQGPDSTGVAVRARTFGQCIDAVRALKVGWGAGSVDSESNDSVGEKLEAVEYPLTPPFPGFEVIDETFTFHFRSGSPLETNCAIADVRSDTAEIWTSSKMPIVAKGDIAQVLGLPLEAVTVHVVEGGGSFGRHLFADAALEAARASQAFGKPVRLMWHRTDDSRHGRMHPMAISRVRATMSESAVTSFEQRHTSVATDFTHGLGDMVSAYLVQQGDRQYGNYTAAFGIFELTQNVPYEFGPTKQLLNEAYKYNDFPTSSVRNIYSPNTVTARELIVDQMAKKLGLDPVEFRKTFLKNDARMLAVIEKCAKVGRWGRKMAPGTAQGFAIMNEYKGRVACLMEIDARPRTVNRTIENAYTGPRITKVLTVVDVGLPINPLGIEAQMMGGAMDGIAQALSAGLHIKDGLPLEGSWDDYRYTRQWNAPFEFQCVVMPATTDYPGGAGELGCGVAQAAAACAYARAVGKMPTEFPINFRKPLGFKVKSKTAPIPQSPTNGLRFAR